MFFFILNIHLSCLSLLSQWTQMRTRTQTGRRKKRGKRKMEDPNSRTLLLLRQRQNLQLLIPPKINHLHPSLCPLLPLFVFPIRTQNPKHHYSPIIIIIASKTITQTAGRRLPVQLPLPRFLLLTWLPNHLSLHLFPSRPPLLHYRLQRGSPILLCAPLLVLPVCLLLLLLFPFCPHLLPCQPPIRLP